ncbi:minichromosome maintenance protein MCM [Candidatus Poseidoniales archaeon]|nr:minichromosome maintenance protein MCM [Candidatus Poseidoniales archaeon]MDC0149892.1 minichromosome maintenance protein MCM [Candidatus Poseidoniales archaeon]
MAAHDSSARWRTFFNEAKESEIVLLLSKQSENAVLPITFHELQAFDPEFAEDVLIDPRNIIDNGRDTLTEICRERGEDIDCLLRVGELPKDSRRDLRDVGSRDIGKLRSAEVIVTKISEIKPRIHRAVFQCEACGHTVEKIQDNERELKEPLRCPEETGCGEIAGRSGGTRFILVMNVSRMVNNQWIEVQEVPENVPSGAQPSRAHVLVEGELVNKHLPGQRVIINMIPVVHSEVKRNKKTPMFDIIYHLVSSEHESTPFTEIKISDEDREAIIDVGSRPDLLQLMQRSIAPSIYATGVVHYVKRSLALQLFGGVSRINKDATRSRGDVHILLMGDPGVAKSQLLNYMSKLSPRGMFATGGGVSGAGLTAAAVRDDFGGGGRFALEAGILPLSDRGMAAIDEFDKISEEDRRTMHPAMEQQRLDVSKGGVKATLNTRCAVLAAANPIRGRFTKRGANESVMHSFNETGLPPALASRFDIIWMLRDEVRVDDDERIGRHILEIRTQGISESKIDEAMELDLREADEGLIYDKGVDGSEHLTVEFLRKFIAYAKRNIHPDLNTDAKALILDYYTKERQSFGRDEQQYAETEVIPITPRALEGLIRLTEAHARMHLREIATADDAKMAMAIFRHWREEAGIEDESELMSGVSVSQRNAGNVVRAVLRDLCTDKGVAELTNILNRCENRGVKNFQVEEVLSNMLQSGELFSPRIEEYSFAR